MQPSVQQNTCISVADHSPCPQSSPRRPGLHTHRPVTGSFWAPSPHIASSAQLTPYRPAGHAVNTETHTRHLSPCAVSLIYIFSVTITASDGLTDVAACSYKPCWTFTGSSGGNAPPSILTLALPLTVGTITLLLTC